jgi:ketosteroid isomerase-like protein
MEIDMNTTVRATLLAATAMLASGTVQASPADDMKAVADLDTQYQEAVKSNDAVTMGRILLDDFVLVVGNGNTFTKANLIEAAKGKTTIYEHQEEEAGTQKVRVWGDTAVVTAKLWIKGKNSSGAFERKLWFSDTYVRTSQGWRYAFGQASLPLPASS